MNRHEEKGVDCVLLCLNEQKQDLKKQTKKESLHGVSFHNIFIPIKACAIVRTCTNVYLHIVTRTSSIIKIHQDEKTLLKLEKELNSKLSVDLTPYSCNMEMYSLL